MKGQLCTIWVCLVFSARVRGIWVLSCSQNVAAEEKLTDTDGILKEAVVELRALLPFCSAPACSQPAGSGLCCRDCAQASQRQLHPSWVKAHQGKRLSGQLAPSSLGTEARVEGWRRAEFSQDCKGWCLTTEVRLTVHIIQEQKWRLFNLQWLCRLNESPPYLGPCLSTVSCSTSEQWNIRLMLLMAKDGGKGTWCLVTLVLKNCLSSIIALYPLGTSNASFCSCLSLP